MQEIKINQKISLQKNEFQAERETVIFIHGLAGSSSAWAGYVQRFTRHFNLVLLDLRGHGKSHRYQEFSDYQLSHFSQDMDAVFAELSISNATLVSHSFGCLMAMEYIVTRPDRVKKAVFISPRFDTRNRVFRFALSATAWLTRFAGKLLPGASVPKRLDYRDFPKNTDFNPSRMYSDIANTGLRTYIHCLRHSLRVDYEQKARRVDCPVLLIHGDADRVFPFRHALHAQKQIPHARLIRVPKANHVVVLTHVDLLHREIEKFISASA